MSDNSTHDRPMSEKINAWRAAHPTERLTYATLVGLAGTPDLQDANLRRANLQDADLQDANLRHANLWDGLVVQGLPSGSATLVPTSAGWALRVGCWTGTPDDLRALIASDTGWPEARGREVARRRPLLAALLILIDAHTTDRADVISDLAARWNGDPS